MLDSLKGFVMKKMGIPPPPYKNQFFFMLDNSKILVMKMGIFSTSTQIPESVYVPGHTI